MEFDRSVLPVHRTTALPTMTMDIRDADTMPFPPLVVPPKGAPNVLVILLDDMGFGASTAFGGPCHMPAAERLAAGGLTFTRFHTTAMCSPTRASLMTGRNHHSVGMGILTDLTTGWPGYTSIRPDATAPIAEILRLNGYNTAAFGKWHQTPTWEIGPTGPFDRWPTGDGFERFYGFMGGETDEWNPTLFDGINPVELPENPDYHLSVDLADRVISYVRSQSGLAPDKPWFTFLSFGATHAPHHAPKDYIERYQGAFDDGWDAQREKTFARQKELGIVPEDCDLTARPEEIPAWDSLDDDHHRLHARMMEVYAAFATHCDDQVGRVIDELDRLGQLDNTLILYVLGDNGASAEAGPDGTLNEFAQYNMVPEQVSDMVTHLDEIGSPLHFNHYPVGWAHAMNTPYQWTKQIASHWGGTRNGMIAHWPAGFDAKGEMRHQFTHCADVGPTILEAAGVPQPNSVNGVDQLAFPTPSFGYAFTDGDAQDRHTTQYFELFGNRAIYHDGWSACTIHSIPWELTGELPPFEEDDWELYAPGDYTQAHNVASEHPEQLRKLQELFLIEASKFNVFPLDDRKSVRLDPALVGRPYPMQGRTQMTLYPGARHLGEASVLNVKNRSHVIRAAITIPEGDPAQGAIIAQGGRFGGWSLYLKDSVPTYAYNWVDHELYVVQGDDALAPGDHTLTVVFRYDGGGVGKGAEAALFVDDTQVASGRIENTVGYMFATTEAMDVGADTAAPVVDDYGTTRGECTATIHHVTIDVDPEQDFDADGMVRVYLQRQ